MARRYFTASLIRIQLSVPVPPGGECWHKISFENYFLVSYISVTRKAREDIKVPKEASWQAKFNSMHNFRVIGPPGGENWD